MQSDHVSAVHIDSSSLHSLLLVFSLQDQQTHAVRENWKLPWELNMNYKTQVRSEQRGPLQGSPVSHTQIWIQTHTAYIG